MKKFFIVLFLFFPILLFARDNEYPVIMNNGTILINTGVGFAGPIGQEATRPGPVKVDSDYKRGCPPLTVSLDYALPVAGLPLTLGLISGYFSEISKTGKEDQINYWPIASRIGYHFYFGVPRLDVYALLTLGARVKGYEKNAFKRTEFWMGLNAGARYFFLPHFGAYAELGFDPVQNITFGMAFNF